MKTESHGPVLQFLAADHERLDALLTAAVTPSGSVDRAAYAEFRGGLLRHIGIEEKILFPAIRSDTAPSVIARLHRDHGALALLLVPTPTAAIVGEIRSILVGHNEQEEGPGGVYGICDRLPVAEVEAVVEAMRAYPPVKLAPHYDGTEVPRTAEDAMRAVSREKAT